MSDWKGELDDAIDKMTEKRGSVREAAFESLSKLLKLHYSETLLESKKETIADGIKKTLRKEGLSQKEKVAALELFSVFAISIGASDSEWQEFQPLFEELLSKTSDQVICASIVETYAMLCFIACQDEKQIQTIASKFAEILDSGVSQASKEPLIGDYKLSLIESWTFLLTSLPAQLVYEVIIPNYLSKIAEFLKEEEVDVRVAVGTLIAFLIQTVRDVEGEEFEMQHSLSSYVDIDEVLQILADLSQDKDKQKGKKDKIKQRAPFRDIKRSVMEGEVPAETLEFKHQKFVFDTWELILQLDRFRAALTEGLQNHCESNSLMKDVFGVVIDSNKPKDKMSATEKRFFMSPNSEKSKSRSRDLNKKRDTKSKSFQSEDE